MKRMLRNKIFNLYHTEKGKKISGPHCFLKGDVSRLCGNCSGIWGNCSGLYGDCSSIYGFLYRLTGDCSGIYGDCSSFQGDLDSCEITQEERKEGVGIEDLVNKVDK